MLQQRMHGGGTSIHAGEESLLIEYINVHTTIQENVYIIVHVCSLFYKNVLYPLGVC